MDDIPLPDDIPTPDDDVSSMLITEQAENIEIVEYVTDVEIENVGLEDIYTQDDTVADMDIQANSPEATVDLPEDMFEIVQLPQTNDADITNEQAENDQRTESVVSGRSFIHSIFLEPLAPRLKRIVRLPQKNRFRYPTRRAIRLSKVQLRRQKILRLLFRNRPHPKKCRRSRAFRQPFLTSSSLRCQKLNLRPNR